MPASIRQATTVDLDSLLAAYEWLFEPPGSRPEAWDAERAQDALVEAIESDGSVVFIAISSADGSLAGFCSAYLDLNSVRFGQRCWVEDLAVAPVMRSQGIGDDLLRSVESWAREYGATHMEADTGVARVDAVRFYERRKPQAKTISYHWRLDI